MKYFKLLQVEHSIKNLLIFFQIIYVTDLFNIDKLFNTPWGICYKHLGVFNASNY